MAGTLKELHGSRTFTVDNNGGNATFLYILFGETDEATAYDLVLAESPPEWYQYTRDSIDMTNRPNLGLWFPVVNYKIPQFATGEPLPPGSPATDPEPSSPSSTPPAPGDTESVKGLQFSVTTEMQRVYRSKETISVTQISGDPTPPALHGLVGLSQTGTDGHVEGVDIPVPVATFRRNKVVPNVDHQYFRSLMYCCGKTNSSAWFGFGPEELLFMGCQGQQRGGGDFEIDFEFKFQPTEENITIRDDSPGLVVPEKRGWHYLWTMNRKEKDATSNLMIERPFIAYVERVIESVGFGWLGI